MWDILFYKLFIFNLKLIICGFKIHFLIEKQLSSNQASLFNVQFKDHNLLQDTGTSPIKTEIKNKDIEYATSDHKLNKYESNDCIRRNPKYSFIHNNRENLVRPKENHFRNTKYKTMVSNSTSISKKILF